MDCPPHATYRFLNLFINIIYDQTPSADPLPDPNGIWDPAIQEGINENIPVYLQAPEPDFLDPDYYPSNIHGTMTRRYYESSFGELILLGDYVVVNIKQSTITPNNPGGNFDWMVLVNKSLDMINDSGGLQTIYNHNAITDYDLNEDNIIDFFQICIRNSSSNMPTYYYGSFNIGTGASGSQAFLVPMNGQFYTTQNFSTQAIGNVSLYDNPVGIVPHEFSHQIIGGNDFHASGGTYWKAESGITFLGIQGGYGIMGGAYSGMVSCNGYERWRMHWKSPVYNSTNEYIVANNQPADISREDGDKTFILRDFVTTGDAIRIKLPYNDPGSLNQYIWLEFHDIGNNGKLDYLQYAVKPDFSTWFSCRPLGKSGIYAYYQVGRDILSGPSYVVWPSGQADNLRIISAEGHFDYERNYDFIRDCVAYDNSPIGPSGQITLPNPFCGSNDCMMIGIDNLDLAPLSKNDFIFDWGKYFPDNSFNDSLPYLFDERDAFGTGDRISISTNPAPFNAITYYNRGYKSGPVISVKTSPPNNRTTYLSGLSIDFEDIGDNRYRVSVRWDDYQINNDVRWTGNIVLLEKVYLMSDKTLLVDWNRTPIQINRDPESTKFTPPTDFSLKDGSEFYQFENSHVNVQNRSKLILESGCHYSIDDGATLEIENSAALIIEPCATLVIKGQGRLVIKEGGTICINENANIFIDGMQNFDFQPGYLTGNDCLPVTLENICELLHISTVSNITGNVTWSGKHYKLDDLTIENGGRLTLINTTLEFMKDVRAIVKRGGQMVVDNGSVLTNISSCDPGFWGGVEVWGNSRLSQIPQSNQGSLLISNTGRIENAYTGVFLGKREFEGSEESEQGYTGGIILADSGYFVNNKIAVQFCPYRNVNYSHFSRCHFQTTNALGDNFPPRFFILLDNVNNIHFHGCTFENTYSGSGFTEKGRGILSIDAEYNVSHECISGSSPCTHYRRSVFSNMTYGIYAMNGGSELEVKIDNTDFINNLKGLYMSGFTSLSGAEVICNRFQVFTENPEDSYGMYLDRCTGYHVEENSFFSDASTPMGTGLIVNESGEASNKIYRNTFYNLEFGTKAQGRNRNPRGTTGLCYKCNDFSNTITDMAVIHEGPLSQNVGIAEHQGDPGQSLPPPTDSLAGNTFSRFQGYEFNINNLCNRIKYFHHPNDIYTPLYLKPDPNNGPVYTYQYSVYYTKATSCPSKLSGGGGHQEREMLAQATERADSVDQLMHAVVDGGSTENLANEVVTSIPPEALSVVDELMSVSPYLSDSVMKESILKEEVLNNAMIRDVLVANTHSAKSEEVMLMLEERTVPMPDYMMAQIYQGEDSISNKERLEAAYTSYDLLRNETYNNLIHYYKGDYQNVPSADSLIDLLVCRSTPESYYDLASWYLSQQEYSQMNSTLSQIPQLFELDANQQGEYQAFLSYFDLLQEIKSDTLGSALDSIRIEQLFDIAAEGVSMPAVFARNMLIAKTGYDYAESNILPENVFKSSRRAKYLGAKTPDDMPLIKVFPNPAKEYFILEHHFDALPESAEVSIIDGFGREIVHKPITGKQNQEVMDFRFLKPSVYLVVLKADGNVIAKAKITIIR